MTNKTDWDQYYRAPFPAARWTRRITTRALLDMLSLALGKTPRLAIAEIGGANSCFLEAVVERLRPDEYHIVDNNALGLGRTKAPVGSSTKLELHRADVLDLRFPGQVDCVFSVGLIEHFDSAGTRRAVQAHFDILRPGGIALISFPTPTPLYRVLRFAAESAGLWKFPDERPLELEEVASTASRDGDMLEHRLVWQIGFTQRIAIFRKRASHVS